VKRGVLSVIITGARRGGNGQEKEVPVEERKVERLPDKPRRGLVLVLTGEGKGKTTSCLGMAVRAVGYGMRVAMIQFIKGSLHYGELDGAKRLAPEFELTPMGKGFVGIRGDALPLSEHVAAAGKALATAREKMLSGRCDVVILDEVNVALHLGLLDLSDVVSLIGERPPDVHLILSGRHAHEEVVRLAHLVTEMRNVKHPFELGIEAEKGIDY
jgi:cob(I)alamin adenosyltransferase